ncbi:pyridoxal phosphate-dependent aminotransferase [Trichocoleus sp. FACHB-591]|uniref:pyridoxal phosphate-dependent aminotransferase n=1 Tax=Trichocoleus sp. FACHB-591 TaxID=2692872 RepID=UPI001682EA02|nr:pyridoxal phosphate-dependent aminotransferase [Trichocoleus sp. FACHB-591]MBD2096618.1 pyridoxal phosphate-dependent aminotransferase [Trichocoleus sp. FACHB-591]
MENLISRMQAVQSPIIPIVGELIRQYPGTISLGQGVVYYGPPPEAIAQIPQFLADPTNHLYKANEGIPPLLEAIAAKLHRFNRIEINEQNAVVVTAGSNMAFMHALLAITSVGDEVILQMPYYFNHDMAITIAGCRPVFVPTDENYQLRPEAIAQAITERTRAVVTISPNNPTGVVYPKAALQAVNQLCRDRGIYHISDEAYEYFTYNGVPHISPGSFAGSDPHTISLFSLSKAYGFASWRIGYMVIPASLSVAVKKVQDTILICPPVISQYAAVGALQTGIAYCREHLHAIAEVRHLVLSELQHLDHLCTVAPTEGAFYCFLKVHTDLPAMQLIERLIREHRVAVLPGDTFGMTEGCYLRIGYGALQKETATAGIERLVKGLQSILS